MSSAAPKIHPSRTLLDLETLLTQANYPCIGAISALRLGELRCGEYAGFGRGRSWQKLRAELISFIEEQRATGSSYLTYIAAYPEDESGPEEEFEAALWRELSYLTSKEDADRDWGEAERNPADPNFCFHLEGEKIFVVGLHPESSRLSRRFPYPALVFNLFVQFAELQKQGKYDPMVRINRDRDLKFQGSVNPMAKLHGETWETIQFSGKENSRQWKCPFSFLHRAFKT